MKIKSLKLLNYRNYSFSEIEFSENQNLIFGENAQGKTNLIEAIFYLSCLKTFRGNRDFDAVKNGEKSAEICGSFTAYKRSFDIKCEILQKSRRLFVNGIAETRPTNHIGLIKTVVFSPDDLQLIKEGPYLRRRFCDIAISQMKPSYIRALRDHKKIIENKKNILKSEDREKYSDYFDVLNMNLAKNMAYIISERGAFLKSCEEFANKTTKEISRGEEELSLSYNCDSAVSDYFSEENEKLIRNHLEKRKSAEFESSSCLIGCHRDDFTVNINGMSARDFASQGQIRSAILALKIAEHEIIYKDCGEKPILLLDDVLSELDFRRREFLINEANRGQTIITGCDRTMFKELLSGKIFTVSKGSIISEKSKEV